jgi:hypothetical protein
MRKCVAALLAGAVLVLAPRAAIAQQNLTEFEKAMYGDLAAVQSFGFISAYVQNTDPGKGTSKNEIGLSTDELKQYLRLRFRNNFANIAYKPVTMGTPDCPSEMDQAKAGYLWCGVWTVGTDFPVAYHVDCRIGTLKRYQITNSAYLGYGKQESRDRGDQQSNRRCRRWIREALFSSSRGI